MLNILRDTLSEVEIDMRVDNLVKRQERVEVKSLKNTVAKSEKEARLDALAARLSDV